MYTKIIKSIMVALLIFINSVCCMSDKRTVRILTIDGGGIRGIVPLTVLDDLEEHLRAKGSRVPLAQHFDIVAGTSTGGIIALGLNAGKSAREMLDLYRTQAARIFKRRSFTPIGLRKAPYDAASIEQVFEEYFGDRWLSDCISDVVIPADDLGVKFAHIFSSFAAKERPGQDFLMRDVARATSAAPTYFPAAVIEDKTRLVKRTFADGGLYANDPTYEAIREADERYPDCNFYILSLGTGEAPRPYGDLSLSDGGMISWGTAITDELLRQQQDRHSLYLRTLQENMRRQGREVVYDRVQVSIPDGLSAMDDIRNIDSLIQTGLSLRAPTNTVLPVEKMNKITNTLYGYISHTK